MRYFYFLIIVTTCFAFLPVKQGKAQTINEDRPFTYGILVVTDNSSVHTMRIRRNGNINPIDPALIQLGTVNSAQYDFQGFAPNTSPTFSFTPTTLNGPGSNFFTLSDFEFPNAMNTNGAGNRNNRRVGSRISTSGNGLPYTDGLYTGTVLLNITYP